MTEPVNDDTVPQNAARDNPPLVFVVDDDRDTVTTLSAVLLAEGYSVFGIHKGSDVLPSMRIHKPGALILDIDLPGPSGYALAREIRQEYGHEAPLLIAIAGKWIGQTDQMLGQLAGFDHYCLKPCEPQQVLNSFGACRSRRSSRRNHHPGMLSLVMPANQNRPRYVPGEQQASNA